LAPLTEPHRRAADDAFLNLKENAMTIDFERRTIARSAALFAAGAALAGAVTPERAAAQAPTPSSPVAKSITYSIKPMSFDPGKTKGLSERILVSHYQNNYSGAVKRLNAITEQLSSLDYAKAPVFLINGLKREELIAANSMILHELYFAGLGEESRPGPALADAIDRDFGSFDRWRSEFAAMAKAEGGGSGWVLLTWNAHDKRLINTWAADHTMTLAGGRPILALDMYEHAYQMDYGAKAGDYVDAFMQAIRWSNADDLYGQYSRA
jgi:Fe-Mn family superoxide dismutase